LYSRTCRKHLPVKFRNSSCARQLPSFDRPSSVHELEKATSSPANVLF
jgi:hypothetical protein